MTGWATAAITATLAKAAATPFRRRPGNALCRCQVTADCCRLALDRVDIAVDLIGFGGHVRTAKRALCCQTHARMREDFRRRVRPAILGTLTGTASPGRTSGRRTPR